MGTQIKTRGENGSASPPDFEGGPLKILIIDDDPVDREICRQFLEEDRPGGFVYAEAANGVDGLFRVEAFHPDCVLLDFNLPDFNGLKIIHLLLEGRDFLPCAVVMLTGNGNESVAVKAMQLGVMDYMAKGPASAHLLSRAVFSAVQRFRFREEIARQRMALQQRNDELERIRTALYEDKERYRVLAEAIPQLVWTADTYGGMRYSNQRLREYCGKPDGGLCQIEDMVHPDDRAAFRKLWTEAAVSGLTFETELRLVRAADGTWRRHLMRAVPFNTGEAGSDNWFGTFTDIEDQKRAEEASRHREKLDSIGLLAAGVAHDFNNLLVGIMGGASFAIGHLQPDHSLYPMLEIILRSSEKAAGLTQQLLAYAGQVQVLSESADISSVVRDGCHRARRAVPPNVRLMIESAENMPLIQTSPPQIEQVIANLVINAAEAIGDASGWIRVRSAIPPPGVLSSEPGEPGLHVLGCELPPGDYVSVEVSDSGIGMDRQMLTQIFDPFFTTKFTGRGLGLAVVQGVVRSLGGGIRVVSSPGNGSTFTILLPLREGAREPETTLQKANGTRA